MRLSRRLILVTVCLAVGVLAQGALQWHLSAARATPYPDLARDLSDFPPALANPLAEGPAGDSSVPGGWQGFDRPGLDALRARLPFVADGLVSRVYQPAGAGPPVDLYMVYSRAGEDRKHHPEICIREAAGAPEDLGARAVLFLDDRGRRPVARFRFRTGTARYLTVYYWHYTLDPVASPGETFLQVLHQRLSHPAPSITVQVATAAPVDGLEVVEKDFLVAVDAVLQRDHLPATARIGCDRMPVRAVHD
jgi:hypothetical protein